MKNIFKLVAMIVFVGSFTNCEEDLIIFDAENGQTAISFATTSFNLSIPQEDFILEIPVNSTTSSTSERSFNVNVDSNTGSAGEATIGSLVIPAGEFVGILSINFDFSAIDGNDGDVKDLVLSLTAPSGGASFNDVVSISYFREIICNDAVLTLNTDFWASETGFTITDSSGTVVFQVAEGSLPNGVATYTFDINLADGDYTATITDQFGDGQDDGTVIGNYTLTCSIINLASGGGAIGSSESMMFTINP